MNVAVIFALLVVSVYAGPVIHETDWVGVWREVAAIEPIINSGIEEIRTVATNDNADVGAQMGPKLDAAESQAKAIITKALDAIEAQTWTFTEAEGFFTEVKDILATLQQNIQEELSQLSSAAAGNIRNNFYKIYTGVEKRAQNIYALMPTKSTFTITK